MVVNKGCLVVTSFKAQTKIKLKQLEEKVKQIFLVFIFKKIELAYGYKPLNQVAALKLEDKKAVKQVMKIILFLPCIYNSHFI